jgi:F-type H+-transporting ATPase subunit epsilon
MQVEILTPDKSLFSGEAEVVTLPGTNGQFQILNNHAALVSSLAAGIISIKTVAGGEEKVTISGGVVEVLNNKIIVLA